MTAAEATAPAIWTGDRTYVVAAAVRIQAWLSRTPELKYVRGASAALARLTSAEHVRTLVDAEFSPGVAVCEEGGDVDGVVVLTVPDGRGETVGKQLGTLLRTRLPGVEWQVWHSAHPSYLAAVLAWNRGEVPTTQLAPGLAGVPLVESCPQCRAEPATSGRDRLGRDCLVRLEHANASRDLLTGHLPGRVPRDFEDVAMRGGAGAGGMPGVLGGKDRVNHVATVVADGNAVGAFFEAIAQQGNQALQEAASRALHQATQETVRDATRKVSANDQEVQPVIAHYVGGDDVLVTVSAPLAWRFAVALGSSFPLRLSEAFDSASTGGRGGAVDSVSLGIGITFAHASHPFREAADRARQALTVAKRASRGEFSAVCWVDLTEDQRTFGDRALDIGRIDQALSGDRPGLIESVTRLPAAARASLRDLVRSGEQSSIQGRAAMPADEIRLELMRWARRTRRPDLEDAVGAEDPAHLLPQLRDALSLSRWWPC